MWFNKKRKERERQEQLAWEKRMTVLEEQEKRDCDDLIRKLSTCEGARQYFSNLYPDIWKEK